MSLSIQYDSTFDGFLSVVFEIYRQRLDVGEIKANRLKNQSLDLFYQPFWIETNLDCARRIKRAIVNAASEDVLNLLDVAFRSESPDVEMNILSYLRKLFAGIDPNYGKNPTSDEMLPLLQTAQAVRREAGDMLGMVRFTKLEDGTYFSEISPKYDILALMAPHFRGRFANERWAIYDSSRNYGMYYDGRGIMEISIPDVKAVTAGLPPDAITQLWKDFYKAIAIKERENPRLLKRCLPVRYWKHLPEREASPVSSQDPFTLKKNFALPSVVARLNSAKATVQSLHR
ncbi:MAG: TIGR03915 family putative DNA repair protein [Fibrobacter sp.]|nr:TIGR03915 family putative DNA repair protein [Fibrobacter sp.]